MVRSHSVPACRVTLDGARLEARDGAHLIAAQVDLDVDLFGAAVLQFLDPKLALLNGDKFRPGAAIELALGYDSELAPVFTGEVVALEPLFRRDHPVSLRVICLDSLHRLALASMTRSLADVDDGEIVTQIAHAHGLSADAPQGTREHILQANTSDATFLRRLAQKQGKHVRIEGTKLVVGEPPQGAELSIKPGDGLRRVRLKMKAGAQVGEVSVTGYDSRTKQAFTGTARPQGEVGEGARTHGRGASLTFNGHEVQPPDAATAEQMAQGRLRKLAESHLVAELDLMGDARHLPGATLGLDGFGPQLDGSFRVDRAQHTFHKFAYHTRLKAVRTARKRVPVRRDRPEPVRNDWIELELVDHTGHPVVGQQYRVETMTGEVFEGRLDSRGKARINGVRPGSNHVSFPGYVNEWRRA